MVLQSLANIGGGVRRSLADTSRAVEKNPFTSSRAWFALLRSYYENETYQDVALWQSYKARHRLPRSIRAIYSPTRRAVDAYPGLIYPGAWTEDGRPLPDGTPHALQFPPDILEDRPELVVAALQPLTWGNWGAERMTYVREGGILGTVFVEVVDDMQRRKVYPEIVPLERVVAVTLDATGNVKAYSLEYQALDPDDGRSYLYRKDVDQERITVYRDRQTVSEDRNPYGFVPAAWVKHRNTGGIFGAPVIAGVVPKIDELNRLATSVHNYIAKLQAQPVVFWGHTAPDPMGAKAGPSDEFTVVSDTETIPWLHGTDKDGRVELMMQAVPIEGAGERIDRLLDEIKADLPEVTMDEVISKLPNASGPIIDRMLPSVRGRVSEAQANYDAGTVKLIQMGVAIGGWRLSTGAWGKRSDLTRQQLKFDGFGLDSYAAGLLDITLLPRPLVPTTEMERLTAIDLRKQVAGLSNDAVRRLLGYSDEEIAQLHDEEVAENERNPVGIF